MTRTNTISHDDALVAELRADPAFAAAYLKAALADGEDPRVLLIALRQVATAHGMSKVAQRAHIERESVYRALSPRGNPRFSTIVSILRALGLALSVESSEPTPSKKRHASRSTKPVARRSAGSSRTSQRV